jgi:pseudouridine synthase
MRINKYVALATGLSRRAADIAIANGRIRVNDHAPLIGQDITDGDRATLDGKPLVLPPQTRTIILNKPAGYVVSRDGQGSPTIYDLLPNEYHLLKTVGRLDKDSSGLLLLTNNGRLANELTHPRYNKQKVYEIRLDKPLSDADRQQIEQGVKVEDYVSQLQLLPLENGWQVTLSQGKNRQIRKTFAALGYTVTKLHRMQFGDYRLDVTSGSFRLLELE